MPDRDIDDLIEALILPAWSGQEVATDVGYALIAGSGDVERLVTRSKVGDRATEAALRLAGDLTEDDRVSMARIGHDGPDADVDGYATARSSVDRGDIRSAIIVLCRLLTRKNATCELPLALAICAARLRKFEEARDLALASLERNPRHPRTLCVLGLCDLLRGNKVEAQSRLALAARLARGHPEYREDMRTAQKLLLIRHLS